MWNDYLRLRPATSVRALFRQRYAFSAHGSQHRLLQRRGLHREPPSHDSVGAGMGRCAESVLALYDICVRCRAVRCPSHRHASMAVGDVHVWRENDCQRAAGNCQVLQEYVARSYNV